MKSKAAQTIMHACALTMWAVPVPAAPLPQIDLQKAVKGLRMPLITLKDGSSAGSIKLGSIKIEPQKIGPMRVRIISGPVIRGLAVTLPETGNAEERRSWPQALAEFLQVDSYPSPARIENLRLIGGDGTVLVRARTATFETEDKRLQMRGAVIRPSPQREEELERLWLLLEGPTAGRLVWRSPQHGRIETTDLLEP